MNPEDYGPLLVTTPDGTRIYRNGFLDSRGFFEFNIAIFNFSAEFDPNTGVWSGNDSAEFVTSVGSADFGMTPSEDGISVNVSGHVGFAEIGIIITEDGEVFPVLGLGVGYKDFGFAFGVVIADNDTSYSRLNRITVEPDGTILIAKFSAGSEEYPLRTQTERKPQDRSVRRAEERRRRSGMLRALGPIRLNPGVFATADAARDDKCLINWQDQVIFLLNCMPLGECSSSCV